MQTEAFRESVRLATGKPNTSVSTSEDKRSCREFTESSSDLPDFGRRYEVLSIIGAGGMGTVYKARDTASGALYAIKTLQADLVKDTAALKRFETEADAAHGLVHPHLVTIHDYGMTEASVPYMVLEYLDGNNLHQAIETEGCLEPKRALELFIQIAEGLSYAHGQGVLHRDLKPKNVILTNTAGGESARLVDFGIATVLPNGSRETRDLTQTGEVFGSPHYMSPEQCLGFMVDQRSDIYSFGCLMYETLLGKPPIEGQTPVQLIIGHINSEAPSFPSALKSNRLLATLEGIVLRCLEKDQSARYQTVDELLNDLKLASEGKPVAKHIRTKKLKLSVTVGQIVMVVSVCSILAVFVSQSEIGGHRLLPTNLDQLFVHAVTLIVTLGGAIVLIRTALARAVKNPARLRPAREWLVILLYLVFGLLGAAYIPETCIHLFTDISHNRILSVLDTVHFLRNITVLILGGLTMVLGSGYFLSASNRKVATSSLVGKLSVLSIALIVIVATLFPKTCIAFEVSQLAWYSQPAFPDISLKLLKLANQLDESISTNQSLSRYYMDRKEYGKAVAYLTREIQLSKDPFDKGEIRRARNYLKLGDTKKAIADAETLISRRNGYARNEGYILRAISRGIDGDLDGALVDYAEALKLSPGFGNPAYGYRIGTLYSLNRFDLALGQLEPVLKDQYDEVPHLVTRGIINSQIGRNAAAQADFQKAIVVFNEQQADNQSIEGDAILRGAIDPVYWALAAYAYKRLGNQEKYEQYRSEFEDNFYRLSSGSIEEHVARYLHLEFTKEIKL